jgi:putative ATP-binding cassette transporter
MTNAHTREAPYAPTGDWPAIIGWGPTAVQAWTLTLVSLALVVGNIVVQYGINLWNRAFFNALERHDQTLAYQAIAIFLALAFAAALVAVLQLSFRMRLQILWRQWLTRRLVARWLGEQRFYRLSIAAPDLDAPEFRIAEDAKVATEPVVDFGYGIANAVLTAAVFFDVLWSASGSAVVFGWRIPGFMVYAAILYSVMMSASMMLFGRALNNRIEQRNRSEAQLRYEMGRGRENAESIAWSVAPMTRSRASGQPCSSSARPGPRLYSVRPGSPG